jgi:hypothetical protein
MSDHTESASEIAKTALRAQRLQEANRAEDAAAGRLHPIPPVDEVDLAEERAKALLEIAAKRGVPMEEDTASVVVMDEPWPTRPHLAFRDGVAWQREHSRWGSAPWFMLLLGSKGTGKTATMAWHVARAKKQDALIRPRHPLEPWRTIEVPPALYVLAAHVANCHRAMHDNRDLWATWLSVPLLCVDELGRSRDAGPAFNELTIERYSRGLPIIFAGNEKGPEAREILQLDSALIERFDERLKARGLEWEVICLGPSLRRKVL